MLNQIHIWLKNLIVIIILTSFIELLLPQTRLEKYTRVVFGLFILIAILNPLLSFLDAGYNYNFQNLTEVLTASDAGIESGPDLSEIMQRGENLRESNQQSLRKDYELQVGRQVQALLSFDRNLPQSEVEVTLGSRHQIEQIIVNLERVEELSKLEEQSEPESQEQKFQSELKKSIKDRLANFYGLSAEQVSVKSN